MIDRDTFRRRFGDRCAAFAVIHVEGSLSGLHWELDTAVSAGLDGVFLIDHRSESDYSAVLRLAEATRGSYPKLFVGANLLDLDPGEALAVAAGHPSLLDAIWVDDACIGDGSGPLDQARANASILDGSGVLYFGGVAFKYQREVDDVARAARSAAGLVDVITTSGPATGHAPDVTKVEAMRAGAPGTPIAIASGITPENADRFTDAADAVLVATGISTDGDRLDPQRCRALVQAVAGSRPPA